MQRIKMYKAFTLSPTAIVQCIYITWTCFFSKTPHLSSTALVFQHPTIGRCKRFVKTSRTSILMNGRLLQTRAMMKIVGAPNIDCLEVRQSGWLSKRHRWCFFVEFLRNQWFNWSRFRIWHQNCNVNMCCLKKGPCADWCCWILLINQWETWRSDVFCSSYAIYVYGFLSLHLL